jgi:hypothetical protein
VVVVVVGRLMVVGNQQNWNGQFDIHFSAACSKRIFVLPHPLFLPMVCRLMFGVSAGLFRQHGDMSGVEVGWNQSDVNRLSLSQPHAIASLPKDICQTHGRVSFRLATTCKDTVLQQPYTHIQTHLQASSKRFSGIKCSTGFSISLLDCTSNSLTCFLFVI